MFDATRERSRLAPKGVVFLADDDAMLRDSVLTTLEPHGYVVLPARDGAEALARMRGFVGRGVLLVDLAMPGINGVDLIDVVRRDMTLKDIAIIVVTGAKHLPETTTPFVVVRKPFTQQRSEEPTSE